MIRLKMGNTVVLECPRGFEFIDDMSIDSLRELLTVLLKSNIKHYGILVLAIKVMRMNNKLMEDEIQIIELIDVYIEHYKHMKYIDKSILNNLFIN
jgi:hypothetical protein